jgi:Domain of unknown function (DUF4136)
MARFTSAFLVTVVACAVIQGQDVKTNYMRGTDFSKYRTYSWVTIPGGVRPNQIIDSEIKQSIDSELARKGFTKVDSGTPDPSHAADLSQPPGLPQLPPGLPQPPAGLPQPPDLPHTADSAYQPNSDHQANSAGKTDVLVGYQVGIDRERQWYATGMGDGFPGWGGMRTGAATATSSAIEVGTLVLNIYDPAAKQLVWSGSATKTLNLSKDQDKNRKKLDKAVEKLLKDFPPRRG